MTVREESKRGAVEVVPSQWWGGVGGWLAGWRGGPVSAAMMWRRVPSPLVAVWVRVPMMWRGALTGLTQRRMDQISAALLVPLGCQDVEPMVFQGGLAVGFPAVPSCQLPPVNDQLGS